MQDEYVIAVLFGALATWVVHSSLSTVLLVMSFAASGIIHPPLALSLVIGANIGGALAPYIDQPASNPRGAAGAARQPDHPRGDRHRLPALPRCR